MSLILRAIVLALFVVLTVTVALALAMTQQYPLLAIGSVRR